MDDISDVTKFATSAPEEAAKNISNSNLFSVNPTVYNQNKSLFDQQADALSKPMQAEPAVADYMRQSTEHAALASPDVDHLNYLDRQAKLIGDYVFDRPTTDRQIVELNLKKLEQGGQLSADDDWKLQGLNQDQRDAANRNYGLDGPIEKIPAQIAGVVSELARSIGRQAPIIAGATAAGAAGGAAIGSLAGPGGVGAGAVAGGVQGFTAGFIGANVKDTYDTLVGSTYNELSNMTDDAGAPKNIDHATKAAISRGVGVVGAVVTGAAGSVIAKTAPFLSKFISPSAAKTIVLDPANAAIRATLMHIGEATAAAGGAAGVTEMAKIVGEEMGKNYNGSEASFLNALESAAARAKQYAPRVAEATGTGALIGLGISAPLGILGYGQTRAQFQSEQEAAVSSARDVTPQAPKAIEGNTPDPDRPIDITPTDGAPAAPRQIPPSTKALQLKSALDNMNDVQRTTKMVDLAPDELSNVNKSIFARAGMSKIWLSVQDLRNWATDEKRGEAARNIIDSSGVAAAQMNAPIQVEPHKVMEVAKEYPDIIDHVRFASDAPSALDVKTHFENMAAAEQKRTEILTKLGISPQEVAPPAAPDNVTQLPVKPKGEVTPFDLEGQVRRADEILTSLSNPETKAPQKAKLQSELADIKFKVTDHLKGGTPGDLLIGNWTERAQPGTMNSAEDYLNQPTFTDAIAKSLPGKEVEKFNEAQRRARQSVVDNIRETADHEMRQVQDVQLEQARQTQRQIELDRIENDPAYAIVDRFRRDVTADSKGGKPTSIYAIDPKTLPDNLLSMIDNARLKEHGVFHKGGISAEDSAALLGFDSPADLLKTLARTPTREQIVKARVAAYEADLQQQVKSSVDLNKTAFIKALNANTANHIAEMKFMREQEWPATKAGIKRIALPLPQIRELTNRAYQAVRQTKVGALDANQFRVGERQSQRLAVNAILKNEVEVAFKAKEAAALNSEFQKQTYLAIGRVNRVIKFAGRFNDPSVIQTLKDAGKLYEDAANELMDAFNLNPSKKGLAEQNSYLKWAKEMLARGEGNFEIPEKFSDLRQNVNDMTVEAVELVGDRLRAILKMAKLKNKLQNAANEKAETEQVDAVTEQVDAVTEQLHALALTHPDYKEGGGTPSVQRTKSPGEAARSIFATFETLFNNMTHIANRLDQDKLAGVKGGDWYRHLVGPIEHAQNKERGMQHAFKKFYESNIELFNKSRPPGSPKFEQLEADIRIIPEFKDIAGYNNGRLSVTDLMTLWVNGGDPDGFINRARNAGVTNEIIQQVLDRELEPHHVTYMQNLVDHIASYREETQALQQRTTGQDVDFIEGIPNYHRGKAYPGGYWRQQYVTDYDAAAIKAAEAALKRKQAAVFGDGSEGDMYARQRAAEMTEQGRLEERTGSSKVTDLSLLRGTRQIEEIVHDLSFREAGINVLKLLRQPSIRADIMNITSKEDFGVMMNSVIEAVGRIDSENANYFSDQSRWMKQVSGHGKAGLAISRIGASASSMMVQLASYPLALEAMGPKGILHLTNVLRKMAISPHLLHGFYDFAKELDPTIGNYVDEIDDKLTSTVHKLTPEKPIHPGLSKVWSPAARALRMTQELSMSGVVMMDALLLKTPVVLAAYEQFMAGHTEGWPLEEVQKLSDEEKHTQAKEYANRISKTALTHGTDFDKSSLQKKAGIFATFWNDLRQVFNRLFSMGRRMKWGTKLTYEQLSNGDFKGALKSSKGVAGTMMGMVVVTTMARAAEDYIRGRNGPWDENFDLHSKDGLAHATSYMSQYLAMSPIDQFVDSIPIARDVKYAAFTKMSRGAVKTVQIPVISQLTDIATAVNALNDYLVLDRRLNPAQKKAMLYSASYIFGGAPVNGAYKFAKFLDRMNRPGINVDAISDLHKNIDAWKDYHAKNESPDEKEFRAQLETLDAHIRPQVAEVPPGTADSIRYAMSGGEWSKTNGLYGFSPSQWEAIKAKAPDLGLTDEGRTAKDPTQQEKAVNWSLHDNARQLSSREVPVTQQTLFGAHKLGADDYAKLYKAPADTKLKTVLGSDAISKNPDLANFKTVGQVKLYLINTLDQGRKAHANTEKLTSTTSTNED